MTGTIVPRPVAWVTSLSQEHGTVNAAPFSYFNMISSDPPLVAVSVVRRPDGTMKDTARNVTELGELVIHICDETLVEEMNRTAAPLPHGESEIDLTRLTLAGSEAVGVPGIAEAKVRLECRLESHVPIKADDGRISHDLLIARILRFRLDESIFDEERGYVRTEKLRPVARLAGSEYAELGRLFSIERPTQPGGGA
ncbi:flavin reductase family protein [Saccharibacillus sp. VR-M41]|uniref:Flavin reductase family protein n=2 Tax=Saccharibacillus alkalitolerans TaxID=2705290 RepID=A0ABX0F9Z8_9BACL|nr:flavin reductase family protein [Saccharibacillus alkalitolerans]NGZ77768.1 flavin reductase family protein [Saccharibacillus alkalitolerans]